MKVILFLEEADLSYEALPVDTRKGEQHQPDYLAINPNAKAPALIDNKTTIFDSNAILQYLCEKTGKFGPANSPSARAEMLSWLMFVASGLGPYSGQAVHFKVYAPEQHPYSLNRYHFEAKRHFQILNTRLCDRQYMLGYDYTFIDMAVWGWARLMQRILGKQTAEKMKNVQRLVNEIDDRPAAKRVQKLISRHQFKTKMDAKAYQYMFPGNSH